MAEQQRPTPGSWTDRQGRPGRLGIPFAAVWLLFLAEPVQHAWLARDTLAGWFGLVATVAFGASYLVAFVHVRRRRARLETEGGPLAGVLLLGWLLALTALSCVTIGQSGTAAFVFVAVTAAIWLRTTPAFAVAVGLAVANEVLARVVPGWTEQASLTVAVLAAAGAMWGVQQMMLRNMDLLRAREENARLAVEEERNRFARDLHDILGHSLTVITVKSELAHRLLDVDVDRAREELADLERLSRDALHDVRRAVAGYREMTLPGELARAREALRTADITADLPHSTDDVPGELRELFAWTVREGVTNVIRHSGATRCTVRLDPQRALVEDDGRGRAGESGPREQDGHRGHGHSGPGHGLVGLRERAAAAGAALVTRETEPHGFRLEVKVS